MSLSYWPDAKAHLTKRDKTLGKIIKQYDGEMLASRGDAFYTLARSIAGQQISVKAADSVWKNLEATVTISPDVLSKADEKTLRSAGLSGQKVKYIHALSEYFLENSDSAWDNLSDSEIIAELISIKGIGRWTAEMFLIFHMGRPDVFPIADIGVQKSIFRHYNNDQPLSKPEMTELAADWQPYRTVATWYLWRALDPVPVAY